jgi:hypothetical protein
MGTTTFRHLSPERPASVTYWRRRCVALVVGLTVLALVTWAVSGALGGSAPAVNSGATKSLHGGSAPSPAGAASGGAPSHGTASSSPPAGATAAGALSPCPPGDVVLSLFSSQASYSLRQSPEFEVDVVSTASQTCTFDIGARHVWLKVMTGSVHVWSSADCAEGQASLVTDLHRGVPTVVPIGWDGQIAGPGCPGPGATAARGTYTAVASDGSQTSNSLAFRIG